MKTSRQESHHSQTGRCYTRRCPFSAATGWPRAPVLRHAARYGHRLGRRERTGLPALLDFR